MDETIEKGHPDCDPLWSMQNQSNAGRNEKYQSMTDRPLFTCAPHNKEVAYLQIMTTKRRYLGRPTSPN